ncbi:N-formylglutamate amidohydrolase, partial [Rhodomicrobium udaipurense]
YRVGLNKPYAGGYITEHFGKPRHGIHALQIEVDRSIYMNEETFEKTPAFMSLQRDMSHVVSTLVQELPRWSGGYKVAAE